MQDQSAIEQELFRLLNTAEGCLAADQLAHREGRVRSLVWALTGQDPGFHCLFSTVWLFSLLGWPHRVERRADGESVVFDLPGKALPV